MTFKCAAVGVLVFLTAALSTARAVESVWEYSVQVSSSVQTSPAKVTLTWPQDTNGTPSSYTVYRKAPTDTSWGSGTSLPGSTTTYTDSNVAVGSAYEYRIVKVAGSYTGYGYILTGVNAPLVDQRGKVVLVVDNTVASPLAAELTRLQQDLAGDGWSVVRHDVPRTDSPANVKNLIKSTYNADPANVKAVFLFGHVPVPYSGVLVPDGHPDHNGAWPADVYYGDMDGNWTDSTVNHTQSINTSPTDAARLSNRPGDGKFDQTDLPSALELQVGRVDLSNLPGRTTWGGPATFASEIELLRKYLNKDHNFRHRKVNPARRAVVGDYFGSRGGEAFAASGYRSFAPLVGANNVRNLNVEFNDQRGVWIPQVAANDYLLAYGCGAGSYTSISGLGSGLYNGADTIELVNNNVRGVFNLLFGSWLGDWDTEDNILRAPLATDHGLVSAWSGRPHWFIHSIGLGEPIGHAARVTQNNNGLYQTQINSSQYRIHVALMGDPTLRLHPVVPVANLNGSANGSTAALTWSASNDSAIVGYHVYRRNGSTGSFTRLTSSPVTATNYTDSASASGATYMVRAIKLENTTSGSYYNASQGMFWTVGGASTPTEPTAPTAPAADTSAPSVSISAPWGGATVSGASVTVSANATDNVAVTGVQFKLNGANLGSEDTSAPFSATLNSTTLTNGTHTLSAVARDAAGNMASASNVSITVNNVTSTPTEPTAPTAPTEPTSPTSPTVPAGTTAWFDDALPAGAGGSGNGGDTWNWVSSSPAPISGSKAHQSALAVGLHEHSFNWATPMAVGIGDVLVTYVYIDPANKPTTLMLSFNNGSWEHRAYWGANEIHYGNNNTPGRFNMGAMPAAGQWVRLEIPANAVGLENSSVTGMSFSAYGGRVTWDLTGKASAASAPTAPTEPTSPTSPTSPTAPTSAWTDTAWFDDALPAGAGGSGTGGDNWNWVSSSPAPFSGSKAHQSNLATGLHEHSFFTWGGAPFQIGAGEKLFVYIYIDPANVPSEIMLSFAADNWEHRAYWGADRISYGTRGTAGRYYAGAIPAAGQWVRLEVPASAVGLEGQAIKGMSFSLFDGRATWDKFGKSTPSTTSTPTSPTAPTEPTGTTGVDFTWVDDALPAGALGGGTGGESWNWVTSGPTPFSGAKAHQSIAAAGLHEHSFNWASAKMNVAAGDVLYTYVYLDPANMPSAIMLSFASDNWEHRVYWGADRFPYGTRGTPGRFYAGALPAAGQWVRLEVPASAVGLEGHAVSAMAFSTYDGRVTFDKSGKVSK